MNRYIDAEILKNKILDDMAKAERDGKDLNGYTDALFHLKTTPTADVVEVRHGKWIGINGDQCSNCGKSLRDLMDGDSYYSSEFEYDGFDALVACPFCGAKMDGERREE